MAERNKAAGKVLKVWPDFDTYYIDMLREASAQTPQQHIQQVMAYYKTNTIFGIGGLWYTSHDAATYPANWYKPKGTKVYHGNDMPRRLDSKGNPYYPDTYEEQRYSRNKFKLPELPTDPQNPGAMFVEIPAYELTDEQQAQLKAANDAYNKFAADRIGFRRYYNIV